MSDCVRLNDLINRVTGKCKFYMYDPLIVQIVGDGLICDYRNRLNVLYYFESD